MLFSLEKPNTPGTNGSQSPASRIPWTSLETDYWQYMYMHLKRMLICILQQLQPYRNIFTEVPYAKYIKYFLCPPPPPPTTASYLLQHYNLIKTLTIIAWYLVDSEAFSWKNAQKQLRIFFYNSISSSSWPSLSKSSIKSAHTAW